MSYLPLIAAGIFALAYGTILNSSNPSGLRTVVKSGSVAMLALWALLGGAHWVLCLALVLSAVGDAFLAQKNGEKWLLPGMGAFFAAHVAYVFLFNTELPNGMVTNEAPQLILLVVGAIFLGLISTKLGSMRWPVLTYSVVILAMGCAALSLPPEFAWAKYGALAFILSDMILSLELFVMPQDAPARKVTSPLLWFLYWGGQAAIAWAFIA